MESREMTDANILYAIETLHIRFMETPTERAAHHIGEFIDGSVDDLDPDAMLGLTKYCDALNAAVRFNFQSLTKVETVADEIFEVAA